MRNETVDVYFADLQILAEASGGVTDGMLRSAFLEGLPLDVRRLLKDHMSLNECDID